jgi:hypothetical protein
MLTTWSGANIENVCLLAIWDGHRRRVTRGAGFGSSEVEFALGEGRKALLRLCEPLVTT